MTTHCFKLVCIGALAIFSGQSLKAECFICDDLISVDEMMASCLEAKFEKFNEKIQSSPENYAAIDLGICSDVSASTESSRALSVMPNLTTKEEVKRVYLLTSESLGCLRGLLTNAQIEFNPTATFDLYEMC